MSGHKTNGSKLFDAFAEALILLDLDDETSKQDLLDRAGRLLGAFRGTAHEGTVALVRAAAEAVAAGDVDALSELEAAFSAARTAALAPPKTVAPKKPKAKKTPRVARTETPQPDERVMPLAGDAELLQDFGIRAGEHLDDADEGLLLLEGDPEDRTAIDAVFRAFHTIKGMAGFLALDAISTYAHDAEGLLAAARTDGSSVDDQTRQALFTAVDKMRILVADASGVAVARITGEGDESAAEKLEPHDRRTGDERRVSERRSRAAAPAKSSRAGTLRVDGERLDALLDAIGELVIAESMVSASVRNGDGVAAMSRKLDELDKITRELQQMATSLRMVPLRAVFRRMARLVYDLATKAGKNVEFVTAGEDTELDKTVVERIEDPLVHALRNAIDHGIESPAERKAAGKPEVARVELAAFHSGGVIHIELRDDGRGIDRGRVTAKASADGLIDADATLDGRSLLDVLCTAGFSTAEKVTDVSGRGVGMDVVRRTVEELRGRLDVASEPGVGTTFSVRLPVTLAIIDGMVLRVGEERFVLPLLAIERSVRPRHSDVATVVGSQEMLAVGGQQLLPILRLHDVFGVDDAETDPERAVVVIVSDNGVRAGLLACELLGQQQTVIKPLGEGLPDMPGIAGGAVMPDGRVGLILDAAGLVRSAHDRGGE